MINKEKYKAFYEEMWTNIAAADRELKERLSLLKDKIIPEDYPEEISYYSSELREQLIRASGFCLVSYEWVRPMAKWLKGSRCMELMSGSGILSYALQQCGTNIFATDNYSWRFKKADDSFERMSKHHPWYGKPWTDVKRMGAVRAVKEYGASIDIVIMSWPPNNDSTALRALWTMRRMNPDAMLVFIGDPAQCANSEFYRQARTVKDSEFEKAVSHFKTWNDVSDEPKLYR